MLMDERPETGAEIRTFLIADVRGYTLFTQERGDEAAAKLAAKFAKVAREGVEARGGSVIELRGDEALAVFSSTRQALRASVELEVRFVEETVADPSLPLAVGIGLDAGEAVRVEGGYRGGALNLAARLCGEAGPGEVLASSEVVHLARRVEGLRYLDRGSLHLKGLAGPVRVVRVVPEADEDPAKRLSSILVPARPAAEWRRGAVPRAQGRRRLFPRGLRSRRGVAVGLAVLLLAVGVPLVLANRGGKRGPQISGFPFPSGVTLIDPRTNHRATYFTPIPLQAPPSDIAVGYGAVWVTSSLATSVYEIDPTTGYVTHQYPLLGPAEVIALGEGRVWVGESRPLILYSINPSTHALKEEKAIGGSARARGLAAGLGAVWLTNGSALLQIDPATLKVERTELEGATAVALASDAVWVLNGLTGGLWRIDPDNAKTGSYSESGDREGRTDIEIGFGSVWEAIGEKSQVVREDASESGGRPQTPITVGRHPASLVVGAGSVWVANSGEGTIWRIDPAANRVVAKIYVGGTPSALALDGRGLWVAVGPRNLDRSTRGIPWT